MALSKSHKLIVSGMEYPIALLASVIRIVIIRMIRVIVEAISTFIWSSTGFCFITIGACCGCFIRETADAEINWIGCGTINSRHWFCDLHRTHIARCEPKQATKLQRNSHVLQPITRAHSAHRSRLNRRCICGRF